MATKFCKRIGKPRKPLKTFFRRPFSTTKRLFVVSVLSWFTPPVFIAVVLDVDDDDDEEEEEEEEEDEDEEEARLRLGAAPSGAVLSDSVRFLLLAIVGELFNRVSVWYRVTA